MKYYFTWKGGGGGGVVTRVQCVIPYAYTENKNSFTNLKFCNKIKEVP